MIEYAAVTTGEKKASICQWYAIPQGERKRLASQSLCCTLLHNSEHHQMLAFSLSPVSLWQSQKGRRAGIMPRAAFQAWND
jgi:hypothetical protein